MTTWLTFSVIAAQKGKLGVHFWDITVLETSSLDLLVVSGLICGFDGIL